MGAGATLCVLQVLGVVNGPNSAKWIENLMIQHLWCSLGEEQALEEVCCPEDRSKNSNSRLACLTWKPGEKNNKTLVH